MSVMYATTQAQVTVAPQQHRYQTIEQKRAACYRALLKNPEDTRLRDALMQLSTQQQVRQNAKDGIFINYCRKDELFALDLAMELRAAGQKVWLDMLDVPLEADWDQEVENALTRCGVMLAVSSPNAQAHNELRRERQLFLLRGKIVIPVIAAGEKDAIEAFVPAVDCRTSYNIGLQTLIRLIGTK